MGVAPDGADVRVERLAGGISNTVLRADWADGSVVVKQSLERLRVSLDWEFDRARIFVERRCLDELERIAPGSAPTVVFADPERFVLGMSTLPAGGVVWKDANMAGQLDPRRTLAAAELLARLQSATAGDMRLAREFDDLMPLEQGRIDPYHRTAAALHPDLAGRIDAEVRRLVATRSVLVHGDFSPKNLVAYGSSMMMLDFEVAHWGDPAFDPSFLLSHLILGSCHHASLSDAFVDEAVRFWRRYRALVTGVVVDEAAVVTSLACLLLARIDGKSPVEYLTQEVKRGAVRAFARALLLDDERRLVEAVLADTRQLLRSAGPT